MAEGKPGTLLNSLPDGVVVADADGLVTHLNTRAAALLETRVEDSLGRPLSEVVTLQNLDGVDWYACVRPYDGLTIRRSLQEGSWRTPSGREVLVTGTFTRDGPGGKVTRVSLGLRSARSRERLDRERSDLVATVAHELRSPLTGVKGFTATLLSKWDRLTDSQKLLMLETVDADSDRLTRLIAELLDVARIDSGRLTVRPEPVDVVSILERQLEPLAKAGNRTIRMRAVAKPRLWLDTDKFAQVVANLVENALKHGDGDVTVTVTSRPDGGAEITVDDEGQGIPVDIRNRIFTKFWKHGQRGGSGLGLYIVGGLVNAHGGQVEVESAPTGGARMRVVLPEGKPDVLD